MTDWIRKLRTRLLPDPLAGLEEALGPGFAAMRGRPAPGDLLLFGERAGVFLLRPSTVSGELRREGEAALLNDKPLDPALIEGAALAGTWARERVKAILDLSVWVTPVIVFPRASVQPGPPIGAVHLVDLAYITPLLKMPRSANPAHALVWEQRGRLFEKISLE